MRSRPARSSAASSARCSSPTTPKSSATSSRAICAGWTRRAALTPSPRNGSRMSTSIFFEHLVHEDRVHRSIYTDPMIFELEMTHIFGGVWCYLAHESQLPRVDDYLTTRLGLRPIIVTRDSDGKLRALFNRCTHRGARVCRETRGNTPTF